ncbi:MAG: hypothetical protein JSV41_01275, partial [Gemmatimonadota bacterium]
VEIIATAGDDYVDWSTSIIVRGDTIIEFSLEQRPGYLVIRAFTEGQVEVHDMDVFVDGAVMPDMRLGETVEFPAGVYRVYLCRLRGDGTRVFAEPVSVTITPGGTTEDRRTVKLEERDDCNL